MENQNTQKNMSAGRGPARHTAASDSAADDKTSEIQVGSAANSPKTGNSEAGHSEAIISESDQLRELRSLLLGGPPEEVLNPPPNQEALSKVLPTVISQAYQQQEDMVSAT